MGKDQKKGMFEITKKQWYCNARLEGYYGEQFKSVFIIHSKYSGYTGFVPGLCVGSVYQIQYSVFSWA